MRPRFPSNPEAMIAEQLYRLRDRFEYPAERSRGVLATGGGGGGAPSIVVAASDASELSKSKADLICSGTADQETIQYAIDQMGLFGRVLLSEGTFEVSTNDVINLGGGFIALEGMGNMATWIRSADSTGTIITVGNDSLVKGFRLSGTGAFGGTVGFAGAAVERVRVEEVLFQGLSAGVHIQGNYWVVTHCVEGSGVLRLVLSADGHTGALITDNTFAISAGIDMGGAVNWLIGNNILSGAILFDGTGAGTAEHAAIIGNHWLEGDAFNVALIEGTASPVELSIVGNSFETNQSWAIQLFDADRGLIAANHIDDAWVGIELNGCDDIAVVDNRITGTHEHGIVLIGSSHCLLTGNLISESGMDVANSFDHINISGLSTRNLITANKLLAAAQTRYGVNVGGTGECNLVAGNDLGDPDSYGTDALADTAANTRLSWPNDVIYGDNFTDCGSGS